MLTDAISVQMPVGVETAANNSPIWLLGGNSNTVAVTGAKSSLWPL